MKIQRKAIQSFFDGNKSQYFSAGETLADFSKVCIEFLIALGLLSISANSFVVGFSFIGVTNKVLNWYSKNTKNKLTFEEGMKIVSVLAYIESFEEIFNCFKNHNLSDNLVKNLNFQSVLVEENFELEQYEVHKALACFHETKLAETLNSFLSSCLKKAGLDKQQAETFAQRVAWNTQRCIKKVLFQAQLDQVVQIPPGLINDFSVESQKYESIDEYLKNEITGKLSLKVFNENFTGEDIYVPLQAQLLDDNGEPIKEKSPINGKPVTVDLEDWTKDILQNKDKQDKVIFIQGYPGRGKSLFCLIFANWVKQNLHPLWTPIFIRLRDIRTIEKQFENTLKSVVDCDFAVNDDGWLTDKNTRYLFLLDGFDELVMEGRNSGLEEFLRQVGDFQERCAGKHTEKGHRILITGRSLALQTIDRLMPPNLERVEILPMNGKIQKKWLSKWEYHTDKDEVKLVEEFLEDRNCPDVVKELAKEPLLLYLLAAMIRDRELSLSDISAGSNTESKIRIYEKALNYLLTKQRQKYENIGLKDQQINNIKYVFSEAALCVFQSCRENAEIDMIKARLQKKNKTNNYLIENINHVEDILIYFYFREGNPEGTVEFVHKSFCEFLFAERLKESLENWTEYGRKGGFSISQDSVNKEIYDLFGYGGLTPEIVEYLMGLLKKSEYFEPIKLFNRLNNFYKSWCEGEFIENINSNESTALPKEKSSQLNKHKIIIGQRQVDVYTGLNIMILLLELYRYAQEQDDDDIKQKIIFNPFGEEKGKYNYIINYSDSFKVGTFNSIVGKFLKRVYLEGVNLTNLNLRGVGLIRADLSKANLSDANLNGADLSDANLSDAKLINADLRNANLKKADLNGVDLNGADLNGADLSDANLSDAKLINADLRNANLKKADLNGAKLNGADLSDAYISDANLNDAELINANFRNANLKKADLSIAKLNGADLTIADLIGANLSGADLKNADLKNADLIGANLSGADLIGANLSGANLSGANLSGAKLNDTELKQVDLSSADLSSADLSGANLSGANLSGADLIGANLIGANLSGANLSDANLSGAKLNDAELKQVDLSSADLSSSDLSGANLSGANLSSADLSSADLKGTNLSGVNLKEAKLDFTNFTGAYLRDADLTSTSLCQTNFKEASLQGANISKAEGRKTIFENANLSQTNFSCSKLQSATFYGVDLSATNFENTDLTEANFKKVSFTATFYRTKFINSKLQNADFSNASLNRPDFSDANLTQASFKEADAKGAIFQNAILKNANLEGAKLKRADFQGADLEQIILDYYTNLDGALNWDKARNAPENAQFNQHNYAPEQKQNLAEAAAKIQQLLYQLSQNNSTSIEVVTEAIYQEIKCNPMLKARLKGALKAGGLEALKAIFNHPLFSIPADTVKGWLEAE